MRQHFLFLAVLLTLSIALQSTYAQDKTGKKTEKKETKMTDTKKDKTQGEIMVIETTMGTIEVALFRADAPKTVENFVRLAGKKFYDGLIFHRVIRGFMIQGGDPKGNGTGGPGYKFEDELNPETESYKAGYKRGVVAMANAGPNTNGSQFFIMHQDYPLPHNYTIFGKVVKGQEVVDAIATTPTNKRDRPLTDVVMKHVYLKGAAETTGKKSTEEKKK